MQTKILDFKKKEKNAGFRLMRLEMYNWGTFHRDVWEICPEGYNSLLTGDIGSGKSTLVDAVTTLIVPHHRIIYNKAAGADSKERSLYSYIRGEYKNIKFDYEQSGKAVALRNENNYTVLLGHFYNEGFKKSVTLAQVFWLKDNQTNPERFFVISETDLSIAKDFADFGTNILDLKKRLKKQKHIKVWENFKTYSNKFRQLFGIKNPQALDLFYQTVSMKSVGNLTEFIRQHMLDQIDVESRINDIRKNFDNLNQAHEAVLKAKKQIDCLKPLIKDGSQYHDLDKLILEFRSCREALYSYFAGIQVNLLHKRISELELELKKRSHSLCIIEQDLKHLRDQVSDLKTSIEDNGGRRLEDLQREITHLEKDRDQKKEKEKAYIDLAGRLPLDRVKQAEDFFENQKKVRILLKGIRQNVDTLQLKQVDLQVMIKDTRKELDSLNEELASLKSRKSNIPLKSLMIRKEMVEVLEIDETEMPFVGELIKVDENEGEWEGAIERLLHNFGLSLLVPEHLYARVCRYVEKTHLKGRLVYFRVQKMKAGMVPEESNPGDLINKIRIKPDSPFYDWLIRELQQRFDYICCDQINDFKRLPKAVTKNGQIKTGGRRHEKDDRSSINDRSRYILGWQNKEKINALKKMVAGLEEKGGELADQLNDLMKKNHSMVKHRDNCRDLLAINTYGEILWQPVAAQIQTLMEEKSKIEQGSDILKILREQLTKTEFDIDTKEKDREKNFEVRYRSQQMLDDRQKELGGAVKSLSETGKDNRDILFPKLDRFREETLIDKTVTLQNLNKCQSHVRIHIQKKIDSEERKLRLLTERIIKLMQLYKNSYPAETNEVDAGLESLPEYKDMLDNLKSEDLPRHEAKFKTLLNEGTINSIALFQNQLDKERQEIEKKITTINLSLNEIEYNAGTFIELLTASTPESDVRDFQTDLKQCLSHTLDGNDLYNEEKFLQVKKLLDRFNGREGYADLDRKWTRKVTDVRNWFIFSAVERWTEDNSEREYYSDSSGKSGGQKEKLAYTILASALAYQFGLEWGTKRSRSFRFVVIDEAFGRGSDESTRYGLELFKRLNLQLLIVTPLQKINIIEDYIRAVHFVHNEAGKNSILKNLTVEEYRKEKEKYQQGVIS